MVDNSFFIRQDVRYGRTARGSSTVDIESRNSPISSASAIDALDVARYITQMTSQLEEMAISARLDLLAYFLNMAKAESDLFVRLNTPENVKNDVLDRLGLTDAF